MTFDTKTYPSQPLICEADASKAKGHEKTTHDKPKTPPARQKDVDDDFCEDTQISDWEDEGGAYSDRADAILRDSRINSGSVLASHMDIDEALMTSGGYDGVFTELQADAGLSMSYRYRINSSFNNPIAQLSTLGYRVTPPHAMALPLVKLHQQITP